MGSVYITSYTHKYNYIYTDKGPSLHACMERTLYSDKEERPGRCSQ